MPWLRWSPPVPTAIGFHFVAFDDVFALMPAGYNFDGVQNPGASRQAPVSSTKAMRLPRRILFPRYENFYIDTIYTIC
jgi:hypothetical protein